MLRVLLRMGSNGTILPWRAASLATTDRRLRKQGAPNACGGGALGIAGLVEVRLRAARLEAARSRWQAVTDSSQPTIRLSDDIALRLTPGPRDGSETLAFGIQALATARDFLEAGAPLADGHSDDELRLSAPAARGIDLRSVQA